MASLLVLSVIGGSGCDSVTSLGDVHDPAATINRDGAASAIVGGNVLWVFGDTFTPTGAVGNSGALADPTNPTVVTEPLVNGVPSPIVPISSSESQAATGGGQWVIWPASVINTSPDSALVLSSKFYANSAGWTGASLLISRIDAGQTVATRVAEPLVAPESNFASGPYAYGGYIYLQDCGGLNVPTAVALRVTPTGPSTGDLGFNNSEKCRVGRVPIDRATDRTAYTFWSGVAWLPTSTTAVPVVPGTNAGLSIAWDPYFGKFIALSVQAYSNQIQLSTAPAPEGPWTKPATIYTTPTNTYAVRLHPELSSADMKTLAISYFREDQPDQPGSVVLTMVTLDKR